MGIPFIPVTQWLAVGIGRTRLLQSREQQAVKTDFTTRGGISGLRGPQALCKIGKLEGSLTSGRHGHWSGTVCRTPGVESHLLDGSSGSP